MSIRGILRGFSLKVGPTTRRTYAARIGDLIEGHPTPKAIAASLLKVREALLRMNLQVLNKKLRAMARLDDNACRLHDRDARRWRPGGADIRVGR